MERKLVTVAVDGSAEFTTLTAANLNIENMVNKGRKNVAYTMLDVTGNVDAGLTAQLSGIDAAIRVRIL